MMRFTLNHIVSRAHRRCVSRVYFLLIFCWVSAVFRLRFGSILTQPKRSTRTTRLSLRCRKFANFPKVDRNFLLKSALFRGDFYIFFLHLQCAIPKDHGIYVPICCMHLPQIAKIITIFNIGVNYHQFTA